MTKMIPETLMPSDPLMRMAWADFVRWASGNAEIIEQFKEATGIEVSAPSFGIERMIDQATGLNESIAHKFIEWLNVNHWGPLDMVAGVTSPAALASESEAE